MNIEKVNCKKRLKWQNGNISVPNFCNGRTVRQNFLLKGNANIIDENLISPSLVGSRLALLNSLRVPTSCSARSPCVINQTKNYFSSIYVGRLCVCQDIGASRHLAMLDNRLSPGILSTLDFQTLTQKLLLKRLIFQRFLNC